MASILRVNAADANLRAAPNTTQAPLARLPAGHPVTVTGDVRGAWQPCRTTVGNHELDGFVHESLLRPPINDAVDRLVEAAGAEYQNFNFGTRHETHPDSEQRIRNYWQSFGHHPEPVSTAWSAAFISFIVGQARLPGQFQFSGRHTDYLSDGKKARQRNDATRTYWTVRLSEEALRVGDLVGAYRTGGECGSAVRTYDSLPGDFCAHCDVVVALRDGKATVLGGNVSNTVKAKDVPLTSQGCAMEGGRRIAVMARNF